MSRKKTALAGKARAYDHSDGRISPGLSAPYPNDRATVKAPAMAELIARNAKLYGLSPREKDCAILLIRGLEWKEIAGELGISLHTVRQYLCRAMLKTRSQSSVTLAVVLVSLT